MLLRIMSRWKSCLKMIKADKSVDDENVVNSENAGKTLEGHDV